MNVCLRRLCGFDMGVEGVPVYDHDDDFRVFDKLAAVRTLRAAEREHGSEVFLEAYFERRLWVSEVHVRGRGLEDGDLGDHGCCIRMGEETRRRRFNKQQKRKYLDLYKA